MFLIFVQEMSYVKKKFYVEQNYFKFYFNPFNHCEIRSAMKKIDELTANGINNVHSSVLAKLRLAQFYIQLLLYKATLPSKYTQI
jgi:hypothetical protein